MASTKFKTPEYQAWTNMKQRCCNHSCPNFSDYGGRGIKIHYEWVNDFDAFLKYIGPRPLKGSYSLDRIDNNGNYEPGNVRWADMDTQIQNRRGYSRRAAPSKPPSKFGRPRTDRQPVMVRFDQDILKKIDKRRMKPKYRSRPSMVRWIIYKYFGEAHDQA
jgi:hypothetical protein